MSAAHFEIVKNNSIVLHKVNANAQLVIWKNFRILNESKLNLVDPDFYKKPFNYLKFIYVNYIKRRKKTIAGDAIWVVDVWSVNYYHWMIESLTKILSTRLIFSTVKVVLPAHFKESGFHEQSLKLLNISVEYFDETNDRLFFECLYLPLNVSILGTSNPVYVNLVRNSFLQHTKPAESRLRRVYISRKLARKRKIINEDQLSELLLGYNFEIICFEALTFLEQVKLAAETNILVGLHGAGLTNMIFMETGGTLIELSRKNDDNLCYKHLAFSSRLAYHTFECENLNEDLHESDFSVDIKRFAELLEVALNKKPGKD